MAIKAREVRAMLKGKVIPEVSHIIEMLAEEQVVIKQTLVDLAQSVDRIADIVTSVTDVAGNMKSALDRTKTVLEPDDDLLGPTT